MLKRTPKRLLSWIYKTKMLALEFDHFRNFDSYQQSYAAKPEH